MDTPNEVIPDFSTKPVTDEDFNLVIKGGNNPELRFGDSKKSIDAQFGFVLGESTISDVISRYGSAGVRGNGIIDYYYKKLNELLIRKFPSMVGYQIWKMYV